MASIWLLSASIALQAASGLLAVRLIRETGSRAAWTLIAAGLWGMALRRIVSLYVHVSTGTEEHLRHGYEALGLVTSALMLAGVVLIRPIFRSIRKSKEAAEALAAQNARQAADLQNALSRVRVLTGLLPICSGCKRIRDSQGNWQELEGYVSDHSNAQFSHGLCPECGERLYPEYFHKR